MNMELHRLCTLDEDDGRDHVDDHKSMRKDLHKIFGRDEHWIAQVATLGGDDVHHDLDDHHDGDVAGDDGNPWGQNWTWSPDGTNLTSVLMRNMKLCDPRLRGYPPSQGFRLTWINLTGLTSDWSEWKSWLSWCWYSVSHIDQCKNHDDFGADTLRQIDQINNHEVVGADTQSPQQHEDSEHRRGRVEGHSQREDWRREDGERGGGSDDDHGDVDVDDYVDITMMATLMMVMMTR